MKKIIIAVSLLLCLGFYKHAEAQAFKKGDVILSPGIGLGVYGINYGIGFSVPVVLNADFGVHDYVSVGAYGGFWTKKWDYAFNERYRSTSIHFGARASFHWWQLVDNLVDADLHSSNLDIYFTPWLGYNVRSVNWANGNSTPLSISTANRFQGGAQVGVRYFFNENVGVFAEWGGTPTAYSNWGMSFKF